MKTMQEVQTLISDLQQFYTDVRLLDATAIERIEEGVRSNPKAEDLCYACRHRSRRCHHCAVKSAFENHDQRTKLEYFSPDIVQVSAQYMEVDGAPYVLELLQRMQSDTIVEPDDTEALFSALSGYNTKLYHDPLTDMYNRRYYEEIVRGMKGPIGVALMDLDDFKVYNDTYGHHAGDMALKTAATIVRGCIRQTDALVRFGGDEFLLILPGIPEDYFKIKLEGICEKIHDAIVPGYSHMRLSTSIGGLIQMPSDSMDAVVRQADRLMYQAKVRKNCVVVSGEMLQEDAPGRPNIYHITSEMQENIPLASALHDIGKIAIDEKILNKPGRLTPEEFEVIKTHTTIGADMLSKLDNFCVEPLLQTAYSIARWHHERWDGRGYPDGLKGNEIPIEAQVVALADVYDALTSDRCYKKAYSHEQAVEMILNGECGAFNPMLLECFVEIKDDLKRELEEERRNKA